MNETPEIQAEDPGIDEAIERLTPEEIQRAEAERLLREAEEQRERERDMGLGQDAPADTTAALPYALLDSPDVLVLGAGGGSVTWTWTCTADAGTAVPASVQFEIGTLTATDEYGLETE